MSVERARPWQFEPVTEDPVGGVLDGPVWDGEGLLLCSVNSNEILRFDPTTRSAERVRHSTSATRGLAIGPDGRLFGAQGKSRRVVWYEAGGATFYLNAMLDGRRHGDPQDLIVDRLGRIWFSDGWTADSIGGPVGWPAPDHRSILRLTRVAETDDGIGDWRLERMTHDTLGPRGVALSPDHTTLYITDGGDGLAAPPTLRAYPLTDTGLGPASILHVFEADGDSGMVAEPGAGPHGLCVDADGRLLVAIGGSAGGTEPAIEVFESDGLPLGRHPIPAGAPTNCTFGGNDMETLFVTTMDGQLLGATDTGHRGVAP